jgi:hypothetical protein
MVLTCFLVVIMIIDRPKPTLDPNFLSHVYADIRRAILSQAKERLS